MESIKRAAGYIRVSTAEQSTKGLSIETQIAEIENYAKLNNMRLEEVYIDRGITARKSLNKRADFMRMMKDVESGRINHIIVLRLDRFFRNVYDYHKMMNEYLDPNNCDWSAVKEQYTTTTTNGRLMINLRLAIAEQECDTDSDRIKDVFANSVRNGYAISGAQPWGFKVENRRVVIDEEKREMMNDLLDHVEMTSSVRATLNYMKNTYGVSFHYSSFARLLKKPLLYGSYRGNDNYCEGYITKERFDRIRKLLDKNIKVSEKRHMYIFSGLIVCDECGRRMSGHHYGDKYLYYRCNNHYAHNRCGNLGLTRETKIEEHLHKNIEKLVRDRLNDLVEEMKESSKPKKTSNRKSIEKKLKKLNDLYVNDFIDMEKYKQEYELLQSQIVDEPEEEKKDLSALQNFLNSNYKSIYDDLSATEKRALWRGIVKEIRIRNKDVVDVDFL